MICDHLRHAKWYENVHPGIKAGLKLLTDPVFLSLSDGRHLIDGERLIAMPQRYQTRLPADGKWESHRRYIDIQYILEGAELMGWADTQSLEVSQPYDAQKDVAFYAGPAESLLTVSAGRFAIFFPDDAHMPCLAAGPTPTPIRKTVLKIAVDW